MFTPWNESCPGEHLSFGSFAIPLAQNLSHRSHAIPLGLYAPCSMPSAPCLFPLPSALCSLLFTLYSLPHACRSTGAPCSMRSAQYTLRSAPCPLPSVICHLSSALCAMPCPPSHIAPFAFCAFASASSEALLKPGAPFALSSLLFTLCAMRSAPCPLPPALFDF